MAEKADISPGIIKENSNIFGDFPLSKFNDATKNSHFPTTLKQANITSVFKKGERYSKNDYRPVSFTSISS